MRYGLCRFRGDGLTRQTAFTPDIPDGEPFDMIDLRPDSTKVDGVALVAMLTRDTAVPAGQGVLDLGDGSARDGGLGPVVRAALANRLGITLDGNDTAPDAPGMRIHTALGALAYRIMLNQDKIVPEAGNIHALCLGNERIFERAIPQGGMTVSTDTFTRADSTSLGADWTEDSGNCEISSNKLRVVSGSEGAENGMLFNTDCGSGDMYVKATFSFSGSYGNCGISIRGNSIMNSRFECRVNQATLNCQVIKYVLGSYSEVRAGVGNEFGTWASGDATYKVTCSGNNHTLYHDDVSKVTYSDADNTTNQRGGIWFGYIDNYLYWSADNYEQGKLDEGGPFAKLWGGVKQTALTNHESRW